MNRSTHNGNKEAVLRSIQQGVSEPKAIATWLRIDESATRNAINRLVSEGLIRRKHGGGYELTAGRRCLLAQVWP